MKFALDVALYMMHMHIIHALVKKLPLIAFNHLTIPLETSEAALTIVQMPLIPLIKEVGVLMLARWG